MFNLITLTGPLSLKEAFASSEHNAKYSAAKAIDGEPGRHHDFSTKIENYPWLQVELQKVAYVTRIIIINRHTSGHRTKNLEVRVGDNKHEGTNQRIIKNKLCATYQGPGKNGEKIALDCTEAMKGRYVSVQLIHDVRTVLNLDEIEIYGNPGK